MIICLPKDFDAMQPKLAFPWLKSMAPCQKTCSMLMWRHNLCCNQFGISRSRGNNRGNKPRSVAQPQLLSRERLKLDRDDGGYSSVEAAIKLPLRAPLNSAALENNSDL